MVRLAALIAALLLAVPVSAQEIPEPVEEPRPSRFAAAGWCPVLWGEEQAPDHAAEVEGEEAGEQDVGGDEELGCDAGMGVDLYGRTVEAGRLSLVAVMGTKSVGAGIAWTVRDWSGGARVSVAVGLVAPYSEAGIDVGRHAVALGVTLGFAGRSAASR